MQGSNRWRQARLARVLLVTSKVCSMHDLKLLSVGRCGPNGVTENAQLTSMTGKSVEVSLHLGNCLRVAASIGMLQRGRLRASIVPTSRRRIASEGVKSWPATRGALMCLKALC